MKKPSVFRLSLTVVALAPFTAHAQEGSLEYAPDSSLAGALPVPLDNPALIATLAILIAVLAAWTMTRHPHWRTLSLIALLTAIGVSGLPSVIADRLDIALDNPNGGTVPIPVGPQRYVNESGVALKVTSIQAPCAGGIDFASSACSAGVTRLASGDSCDTEFVCPSAEICDGLDNDLNNTIDDGVTPPESSCVAGNWVCNGIAGWACEVCVADCSGRACGDDGCGGSCGSCAGGLTCDINGLCVEP